MATAALEPIRRNAPDEAFEWLRITYLVHLSRALDACADGKSIRSVIEY